MKKFEPIDLQLFAEPPADPAPQKTDPPSDPPPANPPADPSPDLQAEAQKIADAMVAKKLKGMPTKEELKAFRDWQEQQKTPEQKENEELARVKREAEEYKSKAQTYERERAVIKSGVAPEFAEYVAFAAGKRVDDNIDFDTALAAYLKENSQYKGEAPPVRTGLPQGPGAKALDGVEAAFYERNPELKPK